MNYSLIKYTTAVITFFVVIGAIIYVAFEMDLEYESDEFLLGSTSVTLEVGQSRSIRVVDTPSGYYDSDVEWSSNDDSVVRVVDGVITAVSPGKAVIHASVYGMKRLVDVTVLSAGADRHLVIYDQFGNDHDLAVLDGPGFTDGLLSLMFNKKGDIVITLAGYSEELLSMDPSFLGNVDCDFSTVTMTVTDRHLNEIARSVYDTEKRTVDEVVEENGVVYNKRSSSPMMVIDGLPYGTYDVEFVLKTRSDRTFTVYGSFAYKEGDGNYDSGQTFVRQYAWRADADDDGKTEAFSFRMEYDMGDYWEWTYFNDTVHVNGSSVTNYRYYSTMAWYMSPSDYTDSLHDALRKAYDDEYGKTLPDEAFARFLMTFVQISFGYGTDDLQYYSLEDLYRNDVDYWAVPEQTIYSGIGDCEDTSIVMALLFKAAGFDSGVFVIPGTGSMAASGHAMAAIHIDGLVCDGTPYIHKGDTYYLCESTVNAPYKVLHTYATGRLDHTETVAENLYFTSEASVPGNTPSDRYDLLYSYTIGACNTAYNGSDYYFYPADR
ncbi:MAG: Ig-like domain-containing protein [archaeon]|nr:Ig-like domain-containing protein [archaeon]